MQWQFCLFTVCLWAGVKTVPTQTNVDIEEPSVIVSPALSSGDQFGWAAIFHHIVAPDDGDTMSQSLEKIRLEWTPALAK